MSMNLDPARWFGYRPHAQGASPPRATAQESVGVTLLDPSVRGKHALKEANLGYRFDFAKAVHQWQVDYLRHADAKAAGVIAVCGVILSLITRTGWRLVWPLDPGIESSLALVRLAL